MQDSRQHRPQTERPVCTGHPGSAQIWRQGACGRGRRPVSSTEGAPRKARNMHARRSPRPVESHGVAAQDDHGEPGRPELLSSCRNDDGNYDEANHHLSTTDGPQPGLRAVRSWEPDTFPSRIMTSPCRSHQYADHDAAPLESCSQSLSCWMYRLTGQLETPMHPMQQ